MALPESVRVSVHGRGPRLVVRVLGDRLRLVENEAASNPSPVSEATGGEGAHRARKRST